MRLHRDPEARKATAWFILRRLRKAEESELIRLAGAVEVDETISDGKTGRMNGKRYAWRERKTGGGRGATGGIPDACIREKTTGRIQLFVLPAATGDTVKGSVCDRNVAGAEVQEDPFKGCSGLDETLRTHGKVDHKLHRFVRCDGDNVIANGCEPVFGSFRANLVGVYHRVCVKHPPFHPNEMAGKR